MSLMRQVSLLAAGCQPWNFDVCAASCNGDRFAYCATLAVYVYELDHQFNEFRLSAIMAEHKKTITCISWHPKNPDILATASSDCKIFIWSVSQQKIISTLNSFKTAPVCIGWCPQEKDSIAYIYGRGPMHIWNFTSPPDKLISKYLESMTFFAEVCQFRWNHKKIGKLVFGHVDGSISVVNPGQKAYKHQLRPETVDIDEEDPVTSLEWDPLSTDYLLVSNAHHGTRLIDTESMNVIMNFKLPSSAIKIHTLAWVPSAPGIFVTGDTQAGVLRVWNVSKSTPMTSIKLKMTGFHALIVVEPFEDVASNNNSRTSVALSSTSAACEPPSSPNNITYALPPARILCTFFDGGVGLYDLGKRKWSFLRDMGHMETIFDCKFKPESPDFLATASFDGTIKVWDVNTMTPVHSSPGNEGIIYALSWAPGDVNCICGATAKKGVFLWDIEKGKISKRFNEHGKHTVYNVSWNHKDSRRIASCSSDGLCVVRQLDGTLVKRYKHPGPVYGCDWSLNNRDMIATGCEDKCVRVFYVAASTDLPLKTFSGHTAKVFHVKWSPIREAILCSGSDDGTIKIWDYTEDSCVHTLKGHTAPVRGLLWSPELPYLLLSGSWDHAIRIWDTRDGSCLETVLDHGADVYGLTCHRLRPFTVASCSRDSTVRIWSLSHLASPMQIDVLANRPLDEIVTPSTEKAMSTGSAPLLNGRVSRELKATAAAKGDKSHLASVKLLSDFFTPPCGARNLWDLVLVLCEVDESLLPASYRKGIVHTKHLVRHKASEAQEIETVRASSGRASGLMNKKEDRIRGAASLHIKIGQLERYCELMVELGEWDRALAVAPGVSMDYWRDLMERRATQLMREDNDAAVPYCASLGDVEKLVSFFTSRGQLHDALLVAQVACEGGMALPTTKNTEKKPLSLKKNDVLPSLVNHMTDENKGLLQSTSMALADWYFYSGQPVLAACCHLAVGDVKFSLSKLIRGNELELAVSVGMVLKDNTPEYHLAVELLSRKCEKLGKWDTCITLLKTLPTSENYLIKSCARCQGTVTELNELHEKAGLPSVEECLQNAEAFLDDSKFLEAMKYYLLSSSPELALDVGLNLVRDAMNKPYWVLDDVLGVIQLLSCIRTDRLQQNRISKQRQELLVLSAYLGALFAIRRKYHPIVLPLFKHARQLFRSDKIELAVTTSQIETESEAWLVFNQPLDPSVNPTPEQKAVWDALLKKVGTEPSIYTTGVDIVAGSLLPSHSDVQLSCLTGERIKGPAFFLNDGRSVMSLNNALMWAKVNAFSIIGAGVRLEPF
ncbi:WD repeat-containing protein 17-like [Montipora foliosa]|uniref:WD repeat-containing protein 17-like n=1 Tax=Montipora foliosa TaxID=591990 RepID=UPI0035F13916